jgi:sterigmatocystin biosynthesis cytochrome P450 monooxygenase
VQWYNSRKMDRFIYKVISKRFAEVQSGEAKISKSVLSLALRCYLDENPTTAGRRLDASFQKAAAANIRLFLFAGHDTTSSTLIYCYHLLSSHPKVLARVRSEHDRVFGTKLTASQLKERIVERPHHLNELPYTMAVIKETLRLNPPASSIRMGLPEVDIVDEYGQRYPTEGCHVFMINGALHRNPKYWKNAEQFVPDRWLTEVEDDMHPVEGAWRPFQLGPRSCIGQTLAIMELRVALVMTIREFHIRPAYEEWDAMHPSSRIKTIDGDRVYPMEMGGGGAHPADGYPCRVTLTT